MKKNILLGGLGVLAIGALAASTAYAYQGDALKKGPNHTDVREAAMVQVMNTGDYEAWKKLMPENAGVLSRIHKENFAKFAEMWKLQRAGKITEANVIKNELGLGRSQGLHNGAGVHKGQSQGMHRNIAR